MIERYTEPCSQPGALSIVVVGQAPGWDYTIKVWAEFAGHGFAFVGEYRTDLLAATPRQLVAVVWAPGVRRWRVTAESGGRTGDEPADLWLITECTSATAGLTPVSKEHVT